MRSSTASPTAQSRAILWAGALALALSFLLIDSNARLRSIHNVTDIAIGTAAAPVPDASSPTGYPQRQHRLILPAQGTDGYHWILQTERMLEQGSVRIREVEYDAPGGREVHWSSPVRWWLAGIARVHNVAHPQLSLPQSLESVAPWAGTLLFALFLIAFTPLIATTLGPHAAALFPIGAVALHPFYQLSATGFIDHHGLAAMSGVAMMQLLLAGLRRQSDLAHARRWFAAAGVAGAVGVWVSASTMLPVIAAVIIAVPVASVVHDGVRALPWRMWALAGAAACTGFYIMEYVPAHLGWRLDVNHPLWAAAWLGGVVLIDARTHVGRAVAACLVAAPAAAILIGGTRTFALADPFMAAIHRDYIAEFRPLLADVLQFNPLHLLQGTISVVPLLILPTAAVLSRVDVTLRRRAIIRVTTWAMVIVGAAYAHMLLLPIARGVLAAAGVRSIWVAHATCVALDAAVVWLLFLRPRRRGVELVERAPLALLLMAALPASVLLLLAIAQVRWIGIASGLWLVVLVALAGSATSIRPPVTVRARRAFLLIVLAPFPLFTALLPWQIGYPAALDATQIVARDVAHLLRAREDTEPVVLAAPTSTTWLVWFGGVRGIGTLYWENAEGLEASAATYAAVTEAEARRLIDERGVTHVVLFSWDDFVSASMRLAGRNGESFLGGIAAGGSLPGWLIEVPYTMPAISILRGSTVRVLEVTGGPD